MAERWDDLAADFHPRQDRLVGRLVVHPVILLAARLMAAGRWAVFRWGVEYSDFQSVKG